MIVLAVPLVATINQRGNWTADDTTATAWALQFFALGLAGFALQEVLARAFYALRDTATPVAIAVGGMLLNVALSLALIQIVHGQPGQSGAPGQGPFGGLALANALATMVESALLWLILRRRLNGLYDRQVLGMALRVLLAALAMGVAVALIANWLEGRSHAVTLIAGTLTGLIVFEACALALGVEEARTLPMAFARRLRR